MFHSKFTGHLFLSVVTLALLAPSVWTQQRDRNQNQDPRERPRNERREVKEVYRQWTNRDVSYIITDAERKAYNRLQTDDEREQFIEQFWRRRDPDPDTEENEFKEEHFERIAYANEHYASGIPGWKTDRGRIYIMYGKPSDIESHPAGGGYQREFYEGGGSTTTYPFEKWFYRYIEGVGSGVEIEFVDPTGSGEYRIARSPNEKDAMLHVPGAGMTLREQLGLESRADRISGYQGPNSYMRAQDNPFDRLERLAALQRPPQVKFSDLASAVNTPVIEDNPLEFDMRIDYFRQSDERVVTAITIQTENNDLTFSDIGGVQTARLNIFGRVTAVSGRRVTTFEDPVITTATSSELAAQKQRKSAYQAAIPLAPGTYKVDVIVRDVTSGATGVRHVGFTVPKYDAAKLSTSTLLLASRLQDLSGQVPTGMFVIGQNKVIPNVSGTYRRGDAVGIYIQVYNAGIDQTTLRPSVEVEYVLMKEGKEAGKVTEDWRGMSDAGQRLTLARLLPTSGLTAGDYELVIRIRDRVSGQSLAPSAKFKLIE
ncbi:MAG: GWxTD domain-containing protein [Pyrinomonadaceae bacterium]|nr:GWxTD domain-containing protein [Pyrinomonadaceae bacterium]